VNSREQILVSFPSFHFFLFFFHAALRGIYPMMLLNFFSASPECQDVFTNVCLSLRAGSDTLDNAEGTLPVSSFLNSLHRQRITVTRKSCLLPYSPSTVSLRMTVQSNS
jgi:hypothetical protein